MTVFEKNTKLSLLMKSLSEFYKNESYIDVIKSIVNQESILSLRILDWFITNYSKKHRTYITTPNGEQMDVYMNYKLMLKSFSKKSFDPFNRKNKIYFYYTEDKYIETSSGQLCFFKWCFENNILEYVEANLQVIEEDMKSSLKLKKHLELNDNNITKKRQPLSILAARSITKQQGKFTITFT